MEEQQQHNRSRLAVDVDDGITIEQLIARVQEARGKPMRIHELPGLANETGALCGLWMDTATKDIIIHAHSESPLHRQQFLLHELAHMILLHDRDDKIVTPQHLIAEIGRHLPDLDGATVIKALARDRIDDRHEIEAEALADELAAAMRRRPRSRFAEVFG